jgi:hypothetical protein
MPFRRLPVVVLIATFVTACVQITPIGPAPPTPSRSTIVPSPSLAATAVAVASPTTVPTTQQPTPTATATIAITAVPTVRATTGTATTSEEAVVASMLSEGDVDPTATSSGVDVGTEADDLPGFAASGGLRRVGQTFETDDFMTVYDFRYQFPTAEAASQFLDAEELSLGEVDGGAAPAEPPAQLGDDTRYFTSHLEIIIVQDSFNYLIRVGNVVAKVWIGGSPDVVDADRALAIAQAAALRMESQFGQP